MPLDLAHDLRDDHRRLARIEINYPSAKSERALARVFIFPHIRPWLDSMNREARTVGRVKFAPAEQYLKHTKHQCGYGCYAENGGENAQYERVESDGIFPRSIPQYRQSLPKGFGYIILAGTLACAAVFAALFASFALLFGCLLDRPNE